MRLPPPDVLHVAVAEDRAVRPQTFAPVGDLAGARPAAAAGALGERPHLDAWWDRQRVAAEMDGAHHRLVGTWDQDVLRANGVVLRKRHDRMLLLRFTAGNLRHDTDVVAAPLRDALC